MGRTSLTAAFRRTEMLALLGLLICAHPGSAARSELVAPGGSPPRRAPAAPPAPKETGARPARESDETCLVASRVMALMKARKELRAADLPVEGLAGLMDADPAVAGAVIDAMQDSAPVVAELAPGACRMTLGGR